VIRGIGIDVTEIGRFRRLDDIDDFLDQILTEGERHRVRIRADIDRRTACIFAIKEAALKALGFGLHHGMPWRDMEVTEENTLRFTGALERMTGVHHVARSHVSCAWSRTYVVAVVVLE